MALRLLKLALSMTLLVSSAAGAQEMTVATPRGVRLNVIADLPGAAGRHPAIVLAPGQGYPMDQPALAQTARALAASGVAVFRFNWAYFDATPKGRPSEGLANELEDLRAVLDAARADPRVASKIVSVGGKSLGSVVAWRVFVADPSLRSSLLLTPICSRQRAGETEPRSVAHENYPGFEAERRASLSISGNHDPLCAVPMLYRFASTSKGDARVGIVGGDHSFEAPSLTPADADAARTRNVAAVAALAASFVAEVSGEPGKSTP